MSAPGELDLSSMILPTADGNNVFAEAPAEFVLQGKIIEAAIAQAALDQCQGNEYGATNLLLTLGPVAVSQRTNQLINMYNNHNYGTVVAEFYACYPNRVRNRPQLLRAQAALNLSSISDPRDAAILRCFYTAAIGEEMGRMQGLADINGLIEGIDKPVGGIMKDALADAVMQASDEEKMRVGGLLGLGALGSVGGVQGLIVNKEEVPDFFWLQMEWMFFGSRHAHFLSGI